MNSLFQNAIQSIQLGVEDYRANDPKRALSAVRNFYAGVLLLAKEVLVRAVPHADPEDVLGSHYRPIPDGHGGIEFEASSKRTIDFTDIGKRFKDFGLPIDQSALNELNRIRNDIEHLYTTSTHATVREAIARAFPVVADLFRLAKEQPNAVLGDAWQTMMEVRALYESELEKCRETFDGVDWQSECMASAPLSCPECQSHLVYRTDTSKKERWYANGHCQMCDADIPVEHLIETALKDYFEVESHVAAKDGGESPLYRCPDCNAYTYVIWEDENGCVSCGCSLGECLRCSAHLTPDTVAYDNNELCGYCDNLMSKDD